MLHFQKWKLILASIVVAAGFLFALPNLFPAATLARLPAWLPHKQVNLGLDLQGGAHLLYQLDEKEMVEDWLNTIRGDVRETLRRAHIGYSDLNQDVTKRSVSVKIRNQADLDNAESELRKLAIPVGGNVFGSLSGSYDLDVARDGDTVTLTVTDPGLAHRMTSAIQASIETIRRRVDAFGTTEPSIQREGRDRVLVQVPGISDVERLKKLIGETGKLEFKLVDPASTRCRPPPPSKCRWATSSSTPTTSRRYPTCSRIRPWSAARTWWMPSPASTAGPASRWSPSASTRPAPSASPR